MKKPLCNSVVIVAACIISALSDAQNIIYVDPNAGCTSGSYSVINRTCSGNDGNSCTTIQAAANIVQPGDTVYIRGGLYRDTLSNCSGAICHVIRVNTSGTAQKPIVFENYPGEKVILKGFGFEDADLDFDGKADGPVHSGKREYLFYIDADYIHVKGIEVTNSQDNGLLIDGDYNVAEEIISHDNFFAGIQLGKNKNIDNNIVKLCESYNNRHQCGVNISKGTYNKVENTLSYYNGREPNGNKVLPINGDPAGGGNSDGISIVKACQPSGGANLCPGDTLRGNIVFRNTDDGININSSKSVFEENISFYNGPEGRKGFKVFLNVDSLIFIRNIAYANDERGFEFRVDTAGIYYHNIAIGNGGMGFTGIGGYAAVARNNLGYNNASTDINISSCSGCDIANNWNANGTGSFSGPPQLVNPNFLVNLNFPSGLTIAQKLDFIRNQFYYALSPKDTNSGLVDAGSYMPGFHCSAANDDSTNPMNPNAPCGHWLKSNPDIGVYEFGSVSPGCLGFDVYADITHDCGMNNKGAIDITVTAGTPQFLYNWSGGAISPDISSLQPGIYTVTVTDVLGCMAIKSFNVIQPSSVLNATANVTPDNGTGNGTATAIASGGVIPYVYSWQSSSGGILTGGTLTGLAAGTYTLMVKDSLGCTSALIVTIQSSVGVYGQEVSNTLSIYPNPAEDRIFICFDEQPKGLINYCVYNIAGKLLLSGNSNLSCNSIECSSLAEGWYNIKVIAADNIYHSRFIKK